MSPHAVVFEQSDPLRFAATVETLVRAERSGRDELQLERVRAAELERRVADLQHEGAQRERTIAALQREAEERERTVADLERTVADLERRRADLVAQAEALRAELRILEPEAAEWRAWQERGGWRIFASLVSLRLRAAPPGTRRDDALRATLRATANALERRVARPALGARASAGPERKAMLILSGCPGDAYRYRGEHQAEQLELAGATADSALAGTIELDDAFDRYAAFVLHRVAWDGAIGAFVERARASGKPVVFDTDDLVFDLSAIPFVAALDEMTEAERDLYVDGVRRYGETLREVGVVTVSTESLQEAAAAMAGTCASVPNAVSSAMVDAADRALAASARTGRRRHVVIAYLSGTPHAQPRLPRGGRRRRVGARAVPGLDVPGGGPHRSRRPLRRLRRAGRAHPAAGRGSSCRPCSEESTSASRRSSPRIPSRRRRAA